MNLAKSSKNNWVTGLKAIASLKLTVVCLAILVALVIWGTVYQAEHGLYQAQQKFFHSWFFLLFGVIPFPGTVLVLFVLFINLVASIFFRIGLRLSKLGSVITHLGIIVLLVGGFYTAYFSEESSLMLKEGESSSMSASQHLWELAVWEAKTGPQEIYAVDTGKFSPGKQTRFDSLNLVVVTKEYYKNCSAYRGSGTAEAPGERVINASGIKVLKEKPSALEAGENIAGGIFQIETNSATNPTLLLYGQDPSPTAVKIDGKDVFFSLHKKKIMLPLAITLKDFVVKYYPNSTIPKSYESAVTIQDEGGVDRDVVISMNKPLRFKDYTFFQSSYYIAPDGSEYTILAVVKNAGRLLPYFSSFIIFLGMVIHFLKMLLKGRKKNTKALSLIVPLVPLLVGGMLTGSSGMLHAEANSVNSLDQLRQVVILEQGRKKPLDTYAQNILKQFSGQSTFQKKPAIEWLARVLFTPEATYEDKVFLVTNPEVLDSMGVTREGKARDRYSFSQLKPGLAQLHQLAFKVSRVKDQDRSFIENEIIALYSKLYLYQQLLVSFEFLFPRPAFAVTHAETLDALELPREKRELSFLMLAEKKAKIQAIMTSLQGKNQEEWSDVEKEIAELSRRLDQGTELYRDLPLTIIPFYTETGEEKWSSPWDIALPLVRAEGAPLPKSLILIRDFCNAYLDGDQQKFDTAVQDFNRWVLEQAGGRIRTNAITREVFYNRLDPFYKAKFFYGFSVLFLLLSFIILRKWLYRFAFLLLALGFLLHLYGTVTRMYIMLRPPVTNLYETFLFTGLIVVLLGILLEFFKKKNLGIATGGLAGLVMLMIAGKYALEGDTMGMLVAVLDSNFWLASHVITIILGYSGIVLSGFIGHVYIIQRIFLPKKEELLKNTFQAVYAIQAFGIIFTFLGTVLGGIWADQSWGRFWGWDPKENGALLILLWATILFHARLAKMIKETGFALGAVIGVVFVALAWFGVNLLGVGLHSYGFTSGIANALFIFVIFELLFVIVTLLFLKAGKTPLEVKE
jgi:ABC-type transport system involved in cytochrome c biogenesis permease subunit